MTESNFKSFSGLSNITLDSEAVTMGFGNNGFETATKLNVENREFTLGHQEWAGGPMHTIYKYWITGIRDIDTHAATYHGAMIEDPENMYYSMMNHSGEGYYIVTDPSAGIGIMNGAKTSQSIELAVCYTNVVPKILPMDHYNYSAGDNGLVEFEQSFSGTMKMSAEITNNAADLLATRNLALSYLGYSMNVGESSGPTSYTAKNS